MSKTCKVIKCENCNICLVNGKVVHEVGCITDYLFTHRMCEWCGRVYEPKYRRQEFCSDKCAQYYYGGEGATDEEV